MKLSLCAIVAISVTKAVANPGQCFADNPSLMFDFDGNTGTFFEEGTSNGDQYAWSSQTILDMEGNIVGLSAGLCTVISEDTANATLTDYLCQEYDEFTAGPFAGSTVLVEGAYNAGDGPTTGVNYTIAGGSGCFAGISGYTYWIELNNGTLFRTTWYLQTLPMTSGGATGGSAPCALIAAFLYLLFA